MENYRDEFRHVEREYFWTFPRALFMVVLALIMLCAVGFMCNYLGYVSFGFFNPRYEQIRRNTFEQSQAYTEGQRRDIANLSLEFHDPTKTDAQKTALRSIAIDRINGLPPSLRTDPRIDAFYNELTGSN